MAAALVGGEVLHFGTLAGDAAAAIGHGADAVGGAGRIVPRADDHREDEFVPAVCIGQRVEVVDRDVDVFAGLDVGDFLREDVGPFLREQGGDIALCAGFGVDFFGFFAFADDAADLAFADGHDEIIDGGVLRQGEDVFSLDLGIEGIVKLLGDIDRGDVAVNLPLDIRTLERQGDVFLFLAQINQHCPAAGMLTIRFRLPRRLDDDPDFVSGDIGQLGRHGMSVLNSHR